MTATYTDWRRHRTCDRKERHPTRVAANLVVLQIWRRGEQASAYRCDWCNGFHVTSEEGAMTATGVWLGASRALAREVPAGRPYPHVCGSIVTGTATGREVKLWRRDCAACSWEQGEQRRQVEVTEEMLAAERRRLGERE